MEAWEQWWEMALGSLGASQLLAGHGEARSSASRAYYAAYQAVTALLLYSGLTPPDGREAWGHDLTPDLVRELPTRLLTFYARKDVALRLAARYELRLVADCVGVAEVEEARVIATLKSVGFIINLIRRILPQDKL